MGAEQGGIIDQPKILFIDDQEAILNLFQKSFESKFSIITTPKWEEGLKIIGDENISVVIVDYGLPGTDGLKVLKQISNISPKTRRILVSGALELDITISSINLGLAEKIVAKPWKKEELLEAITHVIAKYDTEQRINNIYELLENPLSIEFLEDNLKNFDLFHLIQDLVQSEKIDNFEEKLIALFKGLATITRLYLQSPNSQIRKSILKIKRHLTDLDVLANQYDQLGIRMWVLSIEYCLAYIVGDGVWITMLREEFHTYHTWLTAIPNQSFQLIFDLMREHREGVLTGENSTKIREYLNLLISIQVDELLIITPSLLKNSKKVSNIKSIILMKDGLPLYFNARDTTVSPTLITGFVTALSNFLQELMSGKGKIETIKHDMGVIEIQDVNDYTAILTAQNTNLLNRIALREFVSRSNEVIKVTSKHKYLNNTEKEKMDKLSNRLFFNQKEIERFDS